MNTSGTNPEQAEALATRMAALRVRESDVRESFVRSGGHGGQNVNKTSTCVMLVHEPSGIRVKCQSTRQQGMNRMIAWQLLLDKIEARQRQAQAAERQRVEKLRRQKRPRSHGSKVRMLADKARHSEKKRVRKDVRDD